MPLQVQHLRRRQSIAEVLKIFKRPDDLFASRHLDQLRIVRPRMTVADDYVPVRQDLQVCDPGKSDSRKLLLVDTPNDFAGGRYFEDAVIIATADQRIAVAQA